MKKFSFVLAAVAALFAAISCDPAEQGSAVTIQLTLDGENYAAEGVAIKVEETGGASYEALTDATGAASLKVVPGAYTASASFKAVMEDGSVSQISGSKEIIVAEENAEPFLLPVSKIKTSQIIIKELYNAGCLKEDGKTSYSNDAYVTIYNNSDTEADASDLVFGILQPGNAHATNKWVNESGELSYIDYVPAYSALWYFATPVKMAPYSSLTVAIFGAIDHSATVPNSVNLSKPEYYVMAKEGVAQITNTKYQVAETIDKSHYLTTSKLFNAGNAWVLSNSCPAFFIASMKAADLQALVDNTDAYDLTGGTSNIGWAPKFPVANILDAVDVWNVDNIEKSVHRFPVAVNAGHAVLTPKLGHTLYRNVDKAATEAIAENAGKLVYSYAGGTLDAEKGTGSTDSSEIDAEASIKAGAKIVYSDTNNSSNDFHERKVSALK